MKISIRTMHLTIAVVANFLIATIIGIYMHSAWMIHDGLTIGVTVFLFIGACTLSLYFWIVILWYVLRPVESLIDTLYQATYDQPPDLQKITQSSSEIVKLSYILKILQDNVRQIELTARELKEQKEYLQTILEAIPDAIITIDATGQIQMANATVEKTFGFSSAELIGQKASILLTPPDGEKYSRELMERYLLERHSKLHRNMCEMEATRKDGTVFPIEIWVSELQYNSHPIFLGIIRDITQRKKAETERENYLHELECSNRELDDFAYIVSHDLKEPLRGLQNFSRFLLEDYESKLEEDGKNKLRTIYDMSQNMEGLLDTLLYYSRLGKTALAIHETDLDEVVQKVIDSCAVNLKEKNTIVEISQKLPVIICDHVRITEVFQNLICNSIKYNDTTENKIEVGMMKDHPRKPGETVFYVRDSGIGIAKEHLETIFKMFKRLHPRGAYGGGTGSGLAIVKKIIVQHGGEIWAESEGAGRGTTFLFTIPQRKKK